MDTWPLSTGVPGLTLMRHYSATFFDLFGFSSGAASGLVPFGINALFIVCLMFSVDPEMS